MSASAQQAAPLLGAFTLFEDVRAQRRQFLPPGAWDQLVARVCAPHATWLRKECCPLISMAEYGDVRTEKGSLRHQANVRAVHGIEGDYDGELVPVASAIERLTAAGVLALVYTSPSHTPERPRWRVLCPLASPVAPEHRRALVGRVNRALGGVLAGESFTLAQSFYIGQVAGAPYEAALVPGRCVDTITDLLPLCPDGSEPVTGATDTDTTDETLRATFGRGEGRHDAMLKLSARWAARGMAPDDIEAALRALLAQSPKGNPRTAVHLRNASQVAASAAAKFRETRAPAAVTDGAVVVNLARVVEQPLEWLCRGVDIPLGKITLLAGDPGVSKSTLTCDLTAAITAGRRTPWLDAMDGDVLLLSAEDDPADTILPRMRVAGADLRRVHVMTAVRDTNDEGQAVARSFNLTRDVDRLREVLASLNGRVRLVVIDPISAYMGGVDSHVNTDVRGALAPLSDLAAEHRVTVLNVSHLNKGSSGGGNALYRVTGSLAFTAAARAVFLVTRDDEQPERRLVLPMKMNLAKESAGFAYRVMDHAGVPRIVWEEERVSVTAQDMLGSTKSERDAEVDDWLREQLRAGKHPASDMWAQSEHLKFSKNRVKAGLKRLGIRPFKEAHGDGRPMWWWALPAKKPAGGSLDALGSMGPLGSLPPQPAQEVQEAQEVQGGVSGLLPGLLDREGDDL